MAPAASRNDRASAQRAPLAQASARETMKKGPQSLDPDPEVVRSSCDSTGFPRSPGVGHWLL